MDRVDTPPAAKRPEASRNHMETAERKLTALEECMRRILLDVNPR